MLPRLNAVTGQTEHGQPYEANAWPVFLTDSSSKDLLPLVAEG